MIDDSHGNAELERQAKAKLRAMKERRVYMRFSQREGCSFTSLAGGNREQLESLHFYITANAGNSSRREATRGSKNPRFKRGFIVISYAFCSLFNVAARRSTDDGYLGRKYILGLSKSTKICAT